MTNHFTHWFFFEVSELLRPYDLGPFLITQQRILDSQVGNVHIRAPRIRRSQNARVCVGCRLSLLLPCFTAELLSSEQLCTTVLAPSTVWFVGC